MNYSRSRFKQIKKVLRKHKIIRGFTPVKLRSILEELGPTYIKIGQILSTRDDILPKEYTLELTKLKENVLPLSFDKVLEIIREELKEEPLKVFKTVDSVPIGSASIGQVHKATLLNDEEVVIKVMRPGIKEIIDEDFILIKRALKYLKILKIVSDVIDLDSIVNETYETMKEEINYLLEADNIKTMNELNKDIKYIGKIKVYEEYLTRHLLVMTYVRGVRICDIEQLAALEFDIKDICEKLIENFFQQIIDYGFFHADPHSGNIIISENKIYFIDFGMVGKISFQERSLYKKALLFAMNHDASGLKDVILSIGVVTSEINHAKLYKDIDFLLTKYMNVDIKEMNIGLILEEIFNIATSNHIKMPRGLTLLMRSILIIQGVIQELNVDVNLIEIVSNHFEGSGINFDEILKNYILTLKQGLIKSIDIPSNLSDYLKLQVKGETISNVQITNLDKFEKENRKSSSIKNIISLIQGNTFTLTALLVAMLFLTKSQFAFVLAWFIIIICLINVLCLTLYLFFTKFKNKK